MENDLVALNPDRCFEVAKCIKPLKLKQEFYQREYLSLEAQDEIKFRMNFYAVAICHQTYTLHHPGLNLYGWDFIEKVFVNLVRQKSLLIDPAYLANSSIKEISEKLALAFSHTGFVADCSLDRLDERAGLMKEASQILMLEFGGKIKSIFEISENRLLAGGSGLYELFQRFG
ncbi:MAG: hypothetical protein K9H16_14875, partial [Bacteroidales bacterium]|nr:hypothetical protein [Bacteroidales bacterium]